MTLFYQATESCIHLQYSKYFSSMKSVTVFCENSSFSKILVDFWKFGLSWRINQNVWNSINCCFTFDPAKCSFSNLPRLLSLASDTIFSAFFHRFCGHIWDRLSLADPFRGWMEQEENILCLASPPTYLLLDHSSSLLSPPYGPASHRGSWNFFGLRTYSSISPNFWLIGRQLIK